MLPLKRVRFEGVFDARTYEPSLRDGRHEAWFPYRNMLFLAAASNVAEVEGFDTICMAVRVWDTEAYTDASREYFTILGAILDRSGHPDRSPITAIFLPHIASHDVARSLYARHRVLLDKTWSCWRDLPNPCEKCAPCRTRREFLATCTI
jgi:7-cyano-7-deazaguanine synthase in queuosine biosynthesis